MTTPLPRSQGTATAWCARDRILVLQGLPARFLEVHLRDEAEPMTLKEAMAEAGRAYLLRTLEEANGNLARAAKIAGVHRVTMYALLPRYGIGIERKVEVKLAGWMKALG